MEDLRVALLQIPLIWKDAEANRNQIDDFLDQLDSETDLVVLPEMFNTSFTMDAPEVAEQMDGPTVQWLRENSSTRGVAICGSVTIQEQDAFFNRFVFVEQGEVVATYDKRHLFRMADEHLTFTAGNDAGVHTFRGWKIMNRVCYDLRFPVWSRSNEVDLQIYVANWPIPRVNAWSKLLMARAIENQCFVIGVNRIGLDENGMKYNGQSIVLDAKGHALTSESNESEGWITATLDYASLAAFREKFPLKLDADRFTVH